MKRSIAFSGLVCLLALTPCGCASYYRVTDPGSGRVYYTSKIQKQGTGVIRFKDEVTQSRVTLHTSEVMEITKDQFKANIHGR